MPEPVARNTLRASDAADRNTWPPAGAALSSPLRDTQTQHFTLPVKSGIVMKRAVRVRPALNLELFEEPWALMPYP